MLLSHCTFGTFSKLPIVFILFLVCVVLPTTAQDRDLRGGRIVIDDNNANLIVLQTVAGPITGGTLLVPDPGGSSSTLLVSNPAVGAQSIVGHLLLENSGAASELRLFEPSGSGTNYTAIRAQVQAGDVTYTLPSADGTSGQVLSTDGSGLLSWTAAGVGAGETFITASASGTLTAERVLTGGTGVTLTDGGANSTMTVAIGQSVATSATPQFAGLTIPNGNINVTTGNLAITTGNISTTLGNITAVSGIVSGSSVSDGTATLSSGILSSVSNLVGPAGSNLEVTSNGSIVINIDEDNSGSGSSFMLETNGSGGDLLRVTETGLTDINSTSGTGGLRVENAHATSTTNILELTDGTNTRFVAKRSGVVGIGSVSSLQNLLTVAESNSSTSQTVSASTGLQLRNKDATDNNWTGISFAGEEDGVGSAAIQARLTSHANNVGELHFSTRNSSGTVASRLIIGSEGNSTFGGAAPTIHTVHSLNNSSTARSAAVAGEATSATTSSHALLGVGNATTTAANTNVALGIREGELSVARVTAIGAEDDATAADKGPSGVVDVTTTLPATNAVTVGTLVVNNVYAKSNSIVLLEVMDGGSGALGVNETAVARITARGAGTFTVEVRRIRGNLTNTGAVAGTFRVGYLIVNPGK